MNPYLRFVEEQLSALEGARALPLGGIAAPPRPQLPPDAPRVLVFAPHPDDECLVGGLPLRLLREARRRVIDVVVTQGSNKDRQAPRLAELRGACAYLGFELVTTASAGLERINARTREQDRAHWNAAVGRIAEIIDGEHPEILFFPHTGDWNSTHIGTHLLLVDALARLEFGGLIVETEYWAPMPAPNLMVESSQADVADLVAATSFHAGEVRRNPYHLMMPAWMQDNVRRGSEIVGGQGGAAPRFAFATLYGVRRWHQGHLQPAYPGGRLLAAGESAAAFLAAL